MITIQMYRQALELIRAGVPQTSIAVSVGVSQSTVSRWSRNSGYQTTSTRGKSRVPNPLQSSELLQSGLSQRTIAKQLGVSRKTVRRWLTKSTASE